MKVILRGYGIAMSANDKFNARAQAKDMTHVRGTGRIPLPPADLIAQAGPRGVLLNWRKADGFTDDISGWRVYKGDEISLFQAIPDPLTTQCFVETTSAASPQAQNFFVSSVNPQQVESAKVGVQGMPIAESGAPSMPVTPPTYTTPFSADELAQIRADREN